MTLSTAVLEAAQASEQIVTLLERAAATWPERPASTYQGKTLSWEQTHRRCRAQAALFADAGVTRGDRVAYLGFNSNVCFEAYFSPALIGAIFVPLNFRLAVGELIECIDDCTPRVLLCEPGFLAQALALSERCASLIQVLVTGDEAEFTRARQNGIDLNGESHALPESFLSLEAAISATLATEDVLAMAPSRGDETLMLFYTGGTTGKSKGVMLSNTNFLCNTAGSIPLYKMQDGWRFLIVGPLFHIAAGARLFSCAALGGHAIILPKFDVPEVLASIAKYRINSATLVPTMFQMLIDHPAFASADLSSMQMVASGAAPMPMALQHRVIDAFAGMSLYQTYGMTEASPIVTSLDAKYHVFDGAYSDKLGSVGLPAPHVRLRIIDEEGVDLPTGSTGEVLAKGDNIMTGYWNLPEQSAVALQDGWYHTGDAGYVDADGFLFLEGRVKDMIVSGGENIYPIEIENVLASHPSVHQCAVIGIPHATWGEAVHAVVLLEESASVPTEKALIDYCRERIATYKCPVSVSFRREPMPLSPINKILKTELRKPFWEGRSSALV
ncbi:MAG: AMP-binding protein [Gammaproteobacteria bacterium]|jgi:acyl-CoA synthetase (AMP-forming)/AMP-acid ligase II|nr:AMP-binding protein [Gammaproteobacteria bacterium]